MLACAALASVSAIPTAAPASAQSDDDDFVLGAANATANALEVSITAGGAAIGAWYGTSIAKYQETTAFSEGRVLDLGIIEELFATTCDGSPPAISPETLPPETRVDSRDPTAQGDGHAAEVFAPGEIEAGPYVGRQVAGAAPGPLGWARTDLEPADGGLVGVHGAQTQAWATIVDGDIREAVAETTAARLSFLAGRIYLTDVRWEARARSGAENSVTGSFSFGRASVDGRWIDPAGSQAAMQGVYDEIQRQLKQLGAKVVMPEVVIEDKSVRVTPLAVKLIDPPFGATLIAPILEAFQPEREKQFEILIAEDCNNATTITILDVALAWLAGAGTVNFSVGGVDALTDDTEFENPFGNIGLSPAPAVPAAPQPQAPAPKPAVETAAGDDTSGTFVPTSSSRFEEGASETTAVIIGAAFVATALLLAALDWFYIRRRRNPALGPAAGAGRGAHET